MKKQAGFFLILLIVSLLGMISISSLYHAEGEGTDWKKLKIGLVVNGRIDDRGMSQVHYDALYRIAMDKNVMLEYFENVPFTEDCRDKIEELINDGCNYIVLSSADYENYARAASIEHPDVCVTVFYGRSYRQNLTTFAGRIYQAQYLAGMVAGMQTETNRIGFYSYKKVPELTAGINAFAIGVQKVNPNAKVILKYSADGEAPKDAIKNFKKTHNIDVLTCDGYNDKVLSFADMEDIWTIGLNMDNVKYHKDSYLVSSIWDFKPFYEKEINRFERGTFIGENLYLGIDDGIVDISPLTDNVKPGIADTVMLERKLLKERKKDIFDGPVYDNEGNIRISEDESLPDKVLFYRMDWYVSGVIVDDER